MSALLTAKMVEVLAVVFILFGSQLVNGIVQESTVYDELFETRRYDRNIYPPCLKNGQVVNVTIDLFLRQIVELKESTQVLRAMTWMRWKWQDCRLSWDDVKWDADNISVSSTLLWVPDVSLFEGTGDPLHMMKQYPARIDAHGTVTYNFPAMIDATCKINMRHFPFDKQKCKLTFSSWVYTKRHLDLHPLRKSGDISTYIDNGEWDLLEMPTEREEQLYGEDDAYVEVYFYVVLNRRPVYYLFNIIFPTSLIALVAILSFCLPPASGEKVSLSVTSLLTQTVFMLMLSQEMPATSDTIPLLQQYFAAILCVVSMSTILTIFVLNLHHRGIHGKPVPRLLRKVLMNKVMVRIFHPTILDQLKDENEQETTTSTKSDMSFSNFSEVTGFENETLTPQNLRKVNGLRFLPATGLQENGGTQAPVFTRSTVRRKLDLDIEENELLSHVFEMLKEILDNSKRKESLKRFEKQWADLAVVVDRIFFALTLMSFILALVVLYLPQELAH